MKSITPYSGIYNRCAFTHNLLFDIIKMMEKLTLKVYAKINLMLDIKGVLSDGYHSLDMVMASCDLYDEIIAEKSIENEVYMDGVLQDAKNTAYRALEVLTLAYGYRLKIKIKKGIPMNAGVGGSSADAAGVFFAYSYLYGIDQSFMTKLALSIGSDVCYMMKGGPAKVKCKGEIIFPIEEYKELNMVMLQKIPGAATKDVYNHYDKVGRQIQNEFEINNQKIFNVLQAPAIELCPSIQESIGELKKYTDKVFMTGSGSAVCGVFDSKDEASVCLDKINGDFAFKKVVQTKPCGIEIISEE